MIAVSMSKERILITGHAGYAEKGKDIVCAGVTALTQTLLQSIEGLTGDAPEYQMAPGMFDLNVKDLSEQARLLIDSFFIGLCSIAREFPAYVRMV